MMRLTDGLFKIVRLADWRSWESPFANEGLCNATNWTANLSFFSKPSFRFNTSRRWNQLSISVMVGLDPAIGYPKPIANDAIPISNHPME